MDISVWNDSIARIYGTLANGGLDARDRLVVAALPLVAKVHSQFMRRNPRYSHLRDDLLGAAQLDLVRVATKHSSEERIKPENLAAYIARSCWQAMIQYAAKNSIVRSVSEKTVRRKRASAGGQAVFEKEFSSLDNDEARTRAMPAASHAPDLLADILTCCNDETDRQIVELRRQQFRDEEIADRIGLSQQTVQRRRVAIEQRYEQLAIGA